MELNDLKKAWQKMSSKEELNESQIEEMLRKHTSNLIERIDRNIKIGFGILFILIALFILDDFFFSPMLLESMGSDFEIPLWLNFLSIFTNALIFVTFIYFVVKYYRVKKSCDISCNLRETLVKIIKTLKIYQRLFFLALIFLSAAMTVSFITGLYNGMEESAADNGVLMSDIPLPMLLLTILVGFVVLVLMVGGIFLLMRWGFRRLYGNYIHKLKNTLNELDEII
ncbi:hypothetical protein SAMN05444280_1233 [Tangfeifania diversioriginum]|uniref:Uncharacterized protein n=2 Tax=Tangfeifania diversioriginum TaxID=1168035 RepID=A0A1M6KDF5_9BACT|nr:hypothetical protein SAMN05444280_1233 [Tangfeifania diversioriginum]